MKTHLTLNTFPAEILSCKNVDHLSSFVFFFYLQVLIKSVWFEVRDIYFYSPLWGLSALYTSSWSESAAMPPDRA